MTNYDFFGWSSPVIQAFILVRTDSVVFSFLFLNITACESEGQMFTPYFTVLSVQVLLQQTNFAQN